MAGLRCGAGAAITRRFNRRQAAPPLMDRAPSGMPRRPTLNRKDGKCPSSRPRAARRSASAAPRTGKVKRNWGHKRHRLISKSKQGKRLRRGTTTLEKGDAKLVLTYMPYMRG